MITKTKNQRFRFLKKPKTIKNKNLNINPAFRTLFKNYSKIRKLKVKK